MSKPHETKKVLTLDSVLTFGKYKHFTVREVIQEDAQWLNWAVEEQLVNLDNDSFNALQENLKQ